MRVDELRTELEEAAGRQPVPNVEAGRRAVRGLVRRRRWAQGAVLGALVVAFAGVGVALTMGDDPAQELQVVDVPQEDAGPTLAPTEETAPVPPITVEELRAFRDHAADAPFWHKVGSVAPETLDDAVRVAEDVGWARIDRARASGIRPDPGWEQIEPYEGAPVLLEVDVVLDVEVRGEGPRIVELPVDTGVAGSMDQAVPVADELVAMAPVGAAAVVILASDGRAHLVALEAEDGTLVAFFESMDPEVAGYDGDGLLAALRDRLP